MSMNCEAVAAAHPCVLGATHFFYGCSSPKMFPSLHSPGLPLQSISVELPTRLSLWHGLGCILFIGNLGVSDLVSVSKEMGMSDEMTAETKALPGQRAGHRDNNDKCALLCRQCIKMVRNERESGGDDSGKPMGTVRCLSSLFLWSYTGTIISTITIWAVGRLSLPATEGLLWIAL
ncbi:hypothetical protein Ddc_11930 [Ditylenchus destructor]|nr:hypothetical protein Ddc_11930 [Ditylenchus destructor]